MMIHKVTPVLNVSNVPESIAWFEQIGWTRGFTWNDGGVIKLAADRNEHGDADFGGVRQDEAEIFLCRDGQGARGDAVTDGVWMSWWMTSPAEVDELHAVALRNGYTVACPPKDEPWGVREFHLRHPDGHTFRVSGGLGKD